MRAVTRWKVLTGEPGWLLGVESHSEWGLGSHPPTRHPPLHDTTTVWTLSGFLTPQGSLANTPPSSLWDPGPQNDPRANRLQRKPISRCMRLWQKSVIKHLVLERLVKTGLVPDN